MKSRGVSGTSGTLAQEMMSGYVEKRGLLLPTPRTCSAMGAALNTEANLEGNRNPNLETVIGRMLLPTPTAIEGTKYTNTYNPDSQMGQSLSAMAGSGLLPTPTARDFKNPSSPDGERITRKEEQGWTIELSDLAAMGNLPTPSARDWKGRTNPGIVKEGSGCIYGETLPDTIGRLAKVSSPKTDGGTFRLSPLFTEEMMGFPFGWTTLPFLSRNGEQNPSKPTATQ